MAPWESDLVENKPADEESPFLGWGGGVVFQFCSNVSFLALLKLQPLFNDHFFWVFMGGWGEGSFQILW